MSWEQTTKREVGRLTESQEGRMRTEVPQRSGCGSCTSPDSF